MRYQVVVVLSDGTLKVISESTDWVFIKEQFNFWANEYRDEMRRISIRRFE